MTGRDVPLQCINPSCPSPRNAVGREVCAECQTPLVYRYLRAVGEMAAAMPTGSLVASRYYVSAPSIWLDTDPQALPWAPPEMPPAARPYLHLHRWSLHVPRVYGFCPLGERWRKSSGGTSLTTDVLLLENAPIDPSGKAYPAISEVWSRSKPLRRIGWLRQILQLWQPLLEEGATASLLSMANLRVQGWRLWVQELAIAPAASDDAAQDSARPNAEFCQWGNLWFAWLAGGLVQVDHPEERALIEALQAWLDPIRQGAITTGRAARDLDFLSLKFQAKADFTPLLATASHTGRARSDNEDACFPPPGEALKGAIAVVCDGIGGHEKGEVASRLAAQLFQLQAAALLAESNPPEPDPTDEPLDPEVVSEQLRVIVRVVNNAIAQDNDAQNRASRQRMGTTLVAAVAVAQPVLPPFVDTPSLVRELYVVHVGDSRAYWLTEHACQSLTVDDDWAGHTSAGGGTGPGTQARPYRESLAQPDGDALWQALGTKDGEAIDPTVLRFIPDEPGLLLLCSDGFSDFGWVEQTWRKYAPIVLAGRATLLDAAELWLKAAVERHGHDNTTLALVECRPALQYSTIPDPWDSEPAPLPNLAPLAWEAEMSEASKALLYTEGRPTPSRSAGTSSAPRRSWLGLAAIVAALMALLGAIVGTRLWQPAPPALDPNIAPPPASPLPAPPPPLSP